MSTLKTRVPDPVLARFLEADTPEKEEAELEALIAGVGPAMRQFIRQKVLLYAEGVTPTERINRARAAEERARRDLQAARADGASAAELAQKARALETARRHVEAAGFGGGKVSREAEHGEDLYGEAVLLLLRRLRELKSGTHSPQTVREEDAETRASIEKFDSLAITVVRNLLNEHLRQKYPQRKRLRGQVVYVLKSPDPATGSRAFALWEREWLAPSAGSRPGFLHRLRPAPARKQWEKLGGLQAWEGQAVQSTPELSALHRDPASFVQARPDLDVENEDLRRLLKAFFSWVKTPLELDHLVTTLARLRRVEDAPALELDRSGEDGEGGPLELEDPGSRFDEQTILREAMRLHLGKVWEAIAGLQPHYAGALLLNLTDPQGESLLHLLPELGIASIRQIAAAAGLAPEKLAELWPGLPLDDRQIGELFQCPAGRVAVWRFRARQRLETLTCPTEAAAPRGGAAREMENKSRPRR